MASASTFTPKTAENIRIFQEIASAPNEEIPIVEMNEQTSRDLPTIWASVEATANRWRGQREIHFLEMPRDRKEFWSAFAKTHFPKSLPVAEEFIRQSDGKGKLAIDLGAGNSPAIKPLLARKWNVVAVDYAPKTLQVLKEQHGQAVTSGALTLVEADIERFELPEQVDLVIAADSLSYIDPRQFRATWEKIHRSLKEGGIFIGTLFRSAVDPENLPEMNLLKELGAWLLPDRRMVRALLTQTGYEVKTCRYRFDVPDEKEPLCIQFVAQKITSAETGSTQDKNS